MIRGHQFILTTALCLACSQFVPPEHVRAADEPVTLWSFLGIPQALQHVRVQTFNRHGKHPGLEPKPPLRAIADPANLPSAVPEEAATADARASAGVGFASMQSGGEPKPQAIAKAAQIKQAEDMAPQKIKALRYLATVGCGCYPGVTEAFMESIDPKKECTEEVRYVAVRAVIDAAGNQCNTCNTSGCCKKELIEKMGELAFKRDDHGCWVEPSDRVRESLQEALQKCCPGGVPIIEVPGPEDLGPERKPAGDQLPTERPEDLPLPENSNPAVPPAEGAAPDGASVTMMPRTELRRNPPTDENASAVTPRSFGMSGESEYRFTDVGEIRTVGLTRELSRRPRSWVTLTTARGTVLRVNPDQTVAIRCPDEGRAYVGSFVTVSRDFLSGASAIGTLKVVSADQGYVLTQPQRLSRPIKSGDDVVIFMQIP